MLRPGGNRKLTAIKLETDEVVTKPEEIARALHQHWKHTFKSEPIDEALLEEWLREVRADPTFQPLEPCRQKWQVRKQDVARAIRHAANSAPGPDGLATQHWRALGSLGVEVLWEVAKDMTQETASPDIRHAYQDEDVDQLCGFNLSILCCIPKGEGEFNERHGTVYTPSQTRPLSLVDVANRLIA